MARQRPTRSAKRSRPARSPGGDEDVYAGLIQDVHDMIDRERLHVPPRIEADAPELPFDLTEVSDAELQSLYSAFGAYAYRTGYLLMLEESKETRCRQAAEEIVTAFLGEQGDAEGTVTALKAQAESIEAVQAWRKRQRMHGILSDSLRKQRDGYDKCCDRLSRLETLRHQEFERSGQRLASRKSGPRAKVPRLRADMG